MTSCFLFNALVTLGHQKSFQKPKKPKTSSNAPHSSILSLTVSDYIDVRTTKMHDRFGLHVT